MTGSRGRYAAALLVLLPACAGLPVPTAPLPIDYTGRGHYQKADVPLDGLVCGEQYARAVAGDAEAERLIAECETDTKAYGWLMGGFIALPLAGVLAAEWSGHDEPRAAGIALGLTSFALGVAFGWVGRTRLSEAVHHYNAQLPAANRALPPP